MKKWSLFLLILGLILGKVILLNFNLNNGFEIHGISIKLLPIADYAGKASPELYLTSTILGYLAFVIFGIINTNKTKSPAIFKSALMYTGIVIVVTYFEFTIALFI